YLTRGCADRPIDLYLIIVLTMGGLHSCIDRYPSAEAMIPDSVRIRVFHGTSAARVICLVLAGVLLGSSPSHGQQLTQYAHTAWRFQEGVFDAAPVSTAQPTDGFLWIGTLNGLIRFDGVHFESWNDRLHELQTCCALSLLGSRDGSLWIGTAVGLAKLNGGQLSAVTKGDGRYNHMIEDRKGRIWAA